jgi:cytochrome P450
MDIATARDRRLYLAAHPFAYPLLRLLARRGPVVRLPGIGVAVNDAALAREILMDTGSFRKDGPGSAGELWTAVLGPSVLLNMEGEAHRAMRRRLAELFTPSSAARLCAEVLDEPLHRLDARLASGAPVDLVEVTRMAAGAVICELVGIRVPGDAAARERAYLDYYRRASQIIAMVRMTTRSFSPAQLARAHAVLDPIADIAARAWAEGDDSTVVGRMRLLGVSEQEARGAVGAFFITGTETVATAFPRLVALLHDSGRAAALGESVRAGAEGPLDAAIDEALRVTTPTPVMLRSVAKPARIGPVAVRPGHRILIVTHNCAIAGGGFDPGRPQTAQIRHLWFGAGPHFCLGYPLAVAELRALARTVLTHAPFRVIRRRPARRVLLPAYARLDIAGSREHPPAPSP